MKIELNTKKLLIICEALIDQVLSRLTYSEYETAKKLEIKNFFRGLKSKLCQKQVSIFLLSHNDNLYSLQFESKYNWQLNKIAQGSPAVFMGDSDLVNYGWEVEPDDVVLGWLKTLKLKLKEQNDKFLCETIDTELDDLVHLSLSLSHSLTEELIFDEELPNEELADNLFDPHYILREELNHKQCFFMEQGDNLYLLEVYPGRYYWRLRLANSNLLPALLMGDSENGVECDLSDEVISWINSLSGSDNN